MSEQGHAHHEETAGYEGEEEEGDLEGRSISAGAGSSDDWEGGEVRGASTTGFPCCCCCWSCRPLSCLCS